MKLKVRRLHVEAILPTKVHKEDAGFDLYTINDGVILPQGQGVAACGISLEVPEGYVGFIKARSGLGFKGIQVHPGVIDSNYRGPITVNLYNHTDSRFLFYRGMRVAQLVILPIPEIEVEEVKVLSPSNRGSNGLGSSGE